MSMINIKILKNVSTIIAAEASVLGHVQKISVEYCTISKGHKLALLKFFSCLKASVADLLQIS